MTAPKFWPLDDDPEDPIYDSPAWGLPGYTKTERNPRRVLPACIQRHKKTCL